MIRYCSWEMTYVRDSASRCLWSLRFGNGFPSDSTDTWYLYSCLLMPACMIFASWAENLGLLVRCLKYPCRCWWLGRCQHALRFYCRRCLWWTLHWDCHRSCFVVKLWQDQDVPPHSPSTPAWSQDSNIHAKCPAWWLLPLTIVWRTCVVKPA